MENKITFTADDGEQVELYVIEETKLNGSTYLLATETEDDDEDTAYIMKQIEQKGSNEVTYVIVDDEKEISAVAPVFEELLEGEVDLVSEDD